METRSLSEHFADRARKRSHESEKLHCTKNNFIRYNEMLFSSKHTDD